MSEQNEEIESVENEVANPPSVTVGGNTDSQSEAERRAEGQKILAALEGTAAQDDEVEEIKTPQQVIGASRRKPAAKKKAAAATSVPAKVKKMMGDGEKYRFYKVDKLGKASLVQDYTAQDLANANSDIELFIQAYLLPTYGDGEYIVKAFSDKGAELRQGSYSVLAPKGDRPSAMSGGNLFEQTMVSSQAAKLSELQEQMRISEREEREALKAANEKQAAQIASMQNGGGSDMMSMMMMMRSEQADAMRRSEAMQRRSELAMEKVRLEAQIAAASIPPPMPLPPPPPPPDPMATILPMLTLLKELMPKAPEQSAETMYLRDRVRDLEKSTEGPRSIDSIFHEANKMDELFQSRYGNQSSGPGDMLKGFLDNFAENMQSIESVITAGAQARPRLSAGEPQAPAEPDPLPDGFIEIIMELDDAETPLDRINVVLRTIQLFATCGIKRYEAIAAKAVTQMSENNKRPVMWLLKQILEECTNRKMITEESSIATYKAFDRHFQQVYETVTGTAPQVDEGSGEEGAPDATDAQGAQDTPDATEPPALPQEEGGSVAQVPEHQSEVAGVVHS